MKLKDMDIVYVVKDSAYNDELRYSLRSVAKNFPHRKVYFYGGKPVGLKPDVQVVVNQVGDTKYDRVQNMLKMICENDDISDDFVLFNDDFFVLNKQEDPFPRRVSVDTLADYIVWIEIKNGMRPTPYTAELKKTLAEIWKKGFACPESYELHVPMVLNKKKLLNVINSCNGLHGIRTIYGNMYDDCEYLVYDNDVKIVDLDSVPSVSEDDFVSTSDESFADGEVGKFIRDMFPKKCKYER